MAMKITRLALRRYNTTLHFSFPPKFVREMGLRAGDYVDLIQTDSNGVKLRFVKIEPPHQLEEAERAAELASSVAAESIPLVEAAE
jgi:hypothetical protein